MFFSCNTELFYWNFVDYKTNINVFFYELKVWIQKCTSILKITNIASLSYKQFHGEWNEKIIQAFIKLLLNKHLFWNK